MASACSRTHFLLVVSALALWLLAPLDAGAQGAAGADAAARAAARQLAQDGIEAFWAEKYSEAEDNLEKGYQLFPTPTLGLWSARARRQLGRWVEAAERYRDAHAA